MPPSANLHCSIPVDISAPSFKSQLRILLDFLCKASQPFPILCSQTSAFSGTPPGRCFPSNNTQQGRKAAVVTEAIPMTPYLALPLDP